MMKQKILLFLLVLFFAGELSVAQVVLNGEAKVEHAEISHADDRVAVSIRIDLGELKIKSNRAVVLTPVLLGNEQSEELPAIKIMGKKRYIKYLRDEQGGYADPEERIIRYHKKENAPINYFVSVPYKEWMIPCRLNIVEDDCGCAYAKNSQTVGPLAVLEPLAPFVPLFAYVQPQVEAVKGRSESGSAFLIFPVNQTEIYPEHKENPRELGKIRSTIDWVKNDPDVEIRSIFIKGYASPEGSYTNNARLAKSRTESLRKYVQKLYGFNASLFSIDSEAENWEGLREYVAASNLKEKEEILTIIGSNLQPDPKEQKIKSAYPEAYRHLLTDCYPSLRRSDYTIEYTVRGFNVEEAKEILKVRPQKLSLQEMYLVAQTYEPGSEAYNDVFDIAVRLYPEDQVANLNAANVAMGKKNLIDAEKYLRKVGNLPEAIHARGVLAAMQGDYAAALPLLEEANMLGVAGAKENLRQINLYLK